MVPYTKKNLKTKLEILTEGIRKQYYPDKPNRYKAIFLSKGAISPYITGKRNSYLVEPVGEYKEDQPEMSYDQNKYIDVDWDKEPNEEELVEE